ncbi:cysteine hydrolase [Nocardia sp. NBC_01730]|uniref:cysteine hydrolase family protein n=1 Tax=Nocardia sp. NBC_01730 TaxID=2975998 RepID=UPI002E0D1FA6|nr:cysteine hydrolase [Nocardia sp. NBC_01730]
MPSTVLLMIDLQNSYLVQDVRDALGWPPIWRLNEVVTECAALLAAARSAGIPVIYSRQTLSPAGQLAFNPRAARHRRYRASRVPHLSPEDKVWRSQLMEAVAPESDDVVLEKTRHSFFAYTELGPILRSLGAQRLIVAGLQTNVCVEATVRAGLEHNFEVAVAQDAVSTDGPALHHAALNSMRVLYVEVAPWRDLIEAGAAWNTAYTTPNYGRDTAYWNDPITIAASTMPATDQI